MEDITTSFKKVADTPLGFTELKRMLGPDMNQCNFFNYDDLEHMNLSQFMSKPTCIIIIFEKYEKTKNKVGHFFTLLFKPSEIEYFDPYGFNLKQLYKITQQPPTLSILLKESGKKVMINNIKYQQLKDDIETCGRWCISRVKMYRYNHKEFYKFMLQPINNFDQKITILTYFL